MGAEAAVGAELRRTGRDFSRSDHFGFLTACPSNIGTGLRVEVVVKLPKLGGTKGFRALCSRLQLRAAVARTAEGTWTVSNAQRLGSSEVEQVNAVAEGVRVLSVLEQKVVRGEEVDLALIAVDGPGS